MSRCIEIAKSGLGTAAPNPMVGALIVHKGKIIGEGFTSAYGGAHAEVKAIQAVNDISLLKEATLYVTLEPCSYFGKTPPCADLIIQHQIPKVVIGILDPHEKVAGKGIQKLKNAGCEVMVGVLKNACREHHKRFLTFHEKKRPYIILKWAETRNGFIAPNTSKRKSKPEPFWITTRHSRQKVHQWRAEEQAILVGTNTVLEDNPKLDVHLWTGQHPMRVFLDRNLKTPDHFHLLDGSIPTLVLTGITNVSRYRKDLHYEVLDFSENVAKQIGYLLYKQNVTSILIEGGTKTLQSFIDAHLWDEARVFIGATAFETGHKAPVLKGKISSTTQFKKDVLNIYTP